MSTHFFISERLPPYIFPSAIPFLLQLENVFFLSSRRAQHSRKRKSTHNYVEQVMALWLDFFHNSRLVLHEGWLVFKYK